MIPTRPTTLHVAAAAAADGQSFWSLDRESLSQIAAHADPLLEQLLTLGRNITRTLTAAQRENAAIILGTAHGCLRSDLDFDHSRREAGGRYASPNSFRRTLPSTHAAELSIQLAIRGPLLVCSAGYCSTRVALLRAAAWLEHMPIEHCIAGGFDWPPDQAPCAALFLLTARPDPNCRQLRLDPKGSNIQLPASEDQTLAHFISWISSWRTSAAGPPTCP